MENIVFNENLNQKIITQIIVEKFQYADEIKEMIIANDYFKGKNETISKKNRVYFDKNRNAIENPNASNARIKNNFLRMLIQQKQDYALSKSFILKLLDEEQEEIPLSDNDYGKEWKTFLDNTLYELCYSLSGRAINNGISWCYIWIENEELKLKIVPSELVYPVWKNNEHKELDKLVYRYNVEQYYGSLNPTINKYAEYWTNTERILFDIQNGYNEISDSTQIEHSHMSDGVNGISWERIPFIALKGTDDEKTLLSFIKEQVDCYDLLSSKSVDGLIDDLDPLLILKGISPDVNDLIEARELAKMTRTISLDSDGDAHYIQAQTPIDSHLKELEVLRRDIIKFGYGVDYEDSRFNGNPNQLVIKSLYQNMDTYVDGLERHFQDFIIDLKYFFDKWFEFTRKGSFNDCQKYTALVKFDRSMMINQSSQIDDALKLAGTGVSKRTQLEFNPVVQDVELELERIDEEKKSVDNDMFNFNKNEEEENEQD